jgi:hypothetical protein
MTVSLLSRLLALPDDILRVVSPCMPLSDLIVLVRCSRRLATVLRSELSHRLDGIFVVNPQPKAFFTSWEPLSFILPRSELQEIFREGQVTETCFGVGICYHFVEVAASNEEMHFCPSLFSGCPSLFRGLYVDNTYLVTDPEMNVDRFVGWLRRLHEQWLAAQQRYRSSRRGLVRVADGTKSA